MKKIIVTIGTSASLLFGNYMNAQDNSQNAEQDHPAICGFKDPDPEWNAWFNESVEAFKTSRASMVNYTIPVIIHVIHGGQAVGTFPNLTNAQLVSQIAIFNADYAGTGLNVGNTPAVWKDLVANTGISFCLATKDPNGNALAEKGIDRVNYTTAGFTNPASGSAGTNNQTFLTYVDAKMKPKTIWDPSKYLNIWVSDRPSDGTGLGVANAPAGSGLSGIDGVVTTGSATTDGLWCYAKCFGKNASVNLAGYDNGRVSSHEIGHYLGLLHTWGATSSTCGDDYCADTPPTKSPNFDPSASSCLAFPYHKGTCSGNSTNGEMTMNIMDYTGDLCKYMFTKDQAARMQTAMSKGTYRKALGTHGLCESPLSVDQLNSTALDLIISPNPTSGNFELSFRAIETADVKIEINNLLGQTIATEFVKNPTGIIHQTFDLSDQHVGVYFVTIKYGSDRIVKKLVKQ
jgi:hypothetical protein